jgi:hypothetical protein
MDTLSRKELKKKKKKEKKKKPAQSVGVRGERWTRTLTNHLEHRPILLREQEST